MSFTEDDDKLLFDLADFFKIFGDSTRLKILYSLFESELNVSDIATKLNMTTTAVSHQLKVLRDSNLVQTRRNGKTINYSLADDHVKEIINDGIEHITEE